MGAAKKITSSGPHTDPSSDLSPHQVSRHSLPAPILLDATAEGIQRKSSGFAKKFLIMCFFGSLSGFASGICLTVLILQGKLDVNKEAIKAFLRSITGH